MALVRNAANTVRRGRIGETTYYVSRTQQVARQARNNSNYGVEASRSEAQQKRRVKWANLVNFYKVSSEWMKKAFETRKVTQTDYNKFMQLNVNSTEVSLTKSEAAAAAAIAAPYYVSQGSLPSIEISTYASNWRTNISVGNLEIGEATTVGEFTRAAAGANSFIEAGMQLSFVSYQQSVDSLGVPRLSCRLYEVTLDPDSDVSLRSYLPEFCSQQINNFLATSGDISLGGFAYIISRLVNGRLMVSTQQLVVNNADLLNLYTSDRQLAAAVKSYGVDSEVVLSPTGTSDLPPSERPFYISSVAVDGEILRRNEPYGSGEQQAFSGKTVVIKMSKPFRTTQAYVSIVTKGEQTPFNNVTYTTDTITASGLDEGLDQKQIAIRVELDGDQIFDWSLKYASSDSGYGGDL